MGFHDEEFFCIASAELLSRRIEVQRLNQLADPSRLICGDLMLPGPFEQVVGLAQEYTAAEKQPVTVLLATPPCQGMSVANHKKGDELARNSLVVRSIEMVKIVRPLVFIFENVPAFMKTICTGMDGNNRTIADEINKELGSNYEYFSQVIQLSEYGSPSSRKRSLTIGVRNDVTWATPLDLYPQQTKAPTLRELIGDLPPLTKMGESADGDILHSFRPYEPRMRTWIKDLKEGETAFENKDPNKRPHRILSGKKVPNVQKNADKYRRVFWDATAPCVHTRNDILASQNTIHPVDDRVFSVRELMRMMGVRDDFVWFSGQQDAGKVLSWEEYRKHDVNIRQCLGEAVPVPVTQSIARNIKNHLSAHLQFSAGKPKRRIDSLWSTSAQKSAYMGVPDYRKKTNAAYYTEPLIAFSLIKRALGAFNQKRKKPIRVLEPSAGSGVFIDVLNQYGDYYKIDLTAVELDHEMEQHLRKKYSSATNLAAFKLELSDYLLQENESAYDLVVGNPPFGRKSVERGSRWHGEPELSVRFLRKALSESTMVALVMPKALLHAKYYLNIRRYLIASCNISTVLDYGEYTFPNVKIETLGLIADRRQQAVDTTTIKSWPLSLIREASPDYVFSPEYPSWLIYRDGDFDRVLSSLHCGLLNVWRDRKVSRRMASTDGVRVIRGRNIGYNGDLVDDSRDYYVDKEIARAVSCSLKRLDGSKKFLAPNLSYNPRAIDFRDIGDSIPDGSCAVLFGDLSAKEAEAFIVFSRSDEFQRFYRVACNFATRSINIDSCLAFWWGVPKL